ncbi:MAG TPA: Flp pilus assembly protein CpaB [Terracidiphilus sp.]|jgi:pilus assembly protein CpaB
MNRKLLTVLLLAFALAAGCSFVVYRMVGHKVASNHAAHTTKVIAASADVRLGSILTAQNITTVEIAGAVPKGALLNPEDVIGRGVMSDLYQGEPILDSRLAPKGSGGGLAANIKPGMRACAVKVDEVVGVAGFVTPGMRVDVLASGDAPGNPDPKEGTKVKTLLQNIAVLSAGTDIQKDAEGKPQQVHVVNLLVDPDQAQLLSLASTHAQIQLVLRNPLDTATTTVQTTAMGSIFTEDAVAAPIKHPAHSGGAYIRPAVARTVSVEVINGAQRSEKKFAASEASE